MSEHKTAVFTQVKYVLLALLAFLVLGSAIPALTATVRAATPICRAGQVPDRDNCIVPDFTKQCGTNQSCVCDPSLPTCNANASTKCTSNDCDIIAKYLNPIINFLAGAVGLIATIVIVIGGIQYSSSADDPGKVQRAKSRIINAVLALLAFFFLWAFLQWLIPGGVF